MARVRLLYWASTCGRKIWVRIRERVLNKRRSDFKSYWILNKAINWSNNNILSNMEWLKIPLVIRSGSHYHQLLLYDERDSPDCVEGDSGFFFGAEKKLFNRNCACLSFFLCKSILYSSFQFLPPFSVVVLPFLVPFSPALSSLPLSQHPSSFSIHLVQLATH